MVYFALNRIGFNCGQDKDKCQYYPKACLDCVITRLKEMGFDVPPNFRIVEMDSEEKKSQALREYVWQKYLDVLNIKRIVLMDSNSGLPTINYPVSSEGVDMGLLSGFIQANVTFSESGEALEGASSSSITPLHHFYEFQYKDFNIILKNGKYLRYCLVLDKKASETLRTVIIEFVRDFERQFWGQILEFQKTGKNTLRDAKKFIADTFNIHFVHPQTLAHTIPITMMEEIKKDTLKNAILNIAKESLNSQNYFFINNLLGKVKGIVDLDNSIILNEIYNMIQQEIILPTTIETAELELQTFQESRAQRIANNEVISSLISTDDEDSLEELKEQAKLLDAETATKMMNNFVKKGKTAEKGYAYKEAQREYEKALYIATGFGLDKDIGKISFMIVELDKIIKKMDLDYALSAAEKAEKRKDFIEAIKNYQKAIDVLNSDSDSSEAESRVKKLKKRIQKLQESI